jgi:hypothetical protein
MLLSDLKKAFQPLMDISHKEKTVDLMGIKITLRTLTPLQEVEIQKNLPDLDNDDSSPIEFVDSFRNETLAHAIVQVEDNDLRSELYVLTGEHTESGVPVKIEKKEAVKEVMSSWPRPVISILFNEFTSLVEDLENDVSSAISSDPELPEVENEVGEKRAQDLNKALDMVQVANRQAEMNASISVIEDTNFSDAMKEVGT